MGNRMKSFIKKRILALHPLFNWPFKLLGKEVSATTFTQFVKHYFVGFLGSVMNYSLFNIMKYGGLETRTANLITGVILTVTVFMLQKYFTYKPDNHSLRQPILFLVNSFLYFFFDTLILMLLIDRMMIAPYISKLLSIVMLSPMSFIFQKFFVFRNNRVSGECRGAS